MEPNKWHSITCIWCFCFTELTTHKNKNEERHAEDNHKRKLIDAERSQHYAGRFRMLLDCTLLTWLAFLYRRLVVLSLNGYECLAFTSNHFDTYNAHHLQLHVCQCHTQHAGLWFSFHGKVEELTWQHLAAKPPQPFHKCLSILSKLKEISWTHIETVEIWLTLI